MSSRPAARGSEAARSIRLALRTSSMVAVSSASPSRCFLFWTGRRARIASPIVLATVAIPPTTQPHPLPIRPHAPRRRLGCAAQETMGGEHRAPRAIAFEVGACGPGGGGLFGVASLAGRSDAVDGFAEVFGELEDPRTGNARRHLLLEILLIARCAALSGGEDCTDMALFGRAKEPLLRQFLRLPSGIPSHDTFSRVFRSLDPRSSTPASCASCGASPRPR